MGNAAESSLLKALIGASHELTLPEKRLVVLALSKINSRCIGNLVVRITTAEYLELASGSREDTAYDQLKRTSIKLYNRSIIVSDSNDGEVHMRWVGCCQYHQGEGWIALRWSADLLPLLVPLRQHLSGK